MPEVEKSAFEPDEQAEIMRLAARLQEAERDKCSLGELESIGAEAGIAPEFVRLAAERVIERQAPPRQRSRPAPNLVYGFLAFFMLVQAVSVWNLLHTSFYGVGGSPLTGLAIVVALMHGICWGAARQPRSELLASIIVPTALFAATAGWISRLLFGYVQADWWPLLPQMLAIQIVVALAGWWLGSLARARTRRVA